MKLLHEFLIIILFFCTMWTGYKAYLDPVTTELTARIDDGDKNKGVCVKRRIPHYVRKYCEDEFVNDEVKRMRCMISTTNPEIFDYCVEYFK